MPKIPRIQPISCIELMGSPSKSAARTVKTMDIFWNKAAIGKPDDWMAFAKALNPRINIKPKPSIQGVHSREN